MTKKKRFDRRERVYAVGVTLRRGWDMLNSRAQRTLKAISGVTPDAW